jgi:MerR, DNA binding
LLPIFAPQPSLKDIAALLELYGDRKRASHEVKQLALRHVATLDAKIAQMMAIRKALAELADRCRGDDRPECPILDELAGGGDPKAVGVRDEDDLPPMALPRLRQRRVSR